MEESLQYDFLVLITGSRWCDVPKSEQWSSRASAHRWLGRWQKDGTLDKMLEVLADFSGCINLTDISLMKLSELYSNLKKIILFKLQFLQ